MHRLLTCLALSFLCCTTSVFGQGTPYGSGGFTYPVQAPYGGAPAPGGTGYMPPANGGGLSAPYSGDYLSQPMAPPPATNLPPTTLPPTTMPPQSRILPPYTPPPASPAPPAGSTYRLAQSSTIEPPPVPASAATGPGGDVLPASDYVAEKRDESWVLPNYGVPAVTWERGLEIGINGTEGNSESFSMRVGGNLKQTSDDYTNTIDAFYLKSSADGIETQNNGLLTTGVERSFPGTIVTAYAKSQVEYDEFKAFDLRLSYSAGMGFKLLDLDSVKLKSRFGGGGSYEIGGAREELVPEAAIGADFEAQITARQKFSLVFDYYPEWEDFENYRIVASAGWEVLLDEEHNLSLKMSADDRYDSTPQGLEPNDINYALLLLWKM